MRRIWPIGCKAPLHHRRKATRARETGILTGMDIQELSRLVENMIRIGTVHSVDHAAVRCRVQTGELVTQWLRWFEGRAGETTTWDPPTVGEQCIVFSPSGEPANGIVFYGMNSAQIAPPSHDKVKHVIKFPDGAVFSYDHAASHLEISGIKTATMIASEQVEFDTPLVRMTGECEVLDRLTYRNGLSGYGGGYGNAITGDFTHVIGNLSSNGIILHTHHHDAPPAGYPT